ncbi:DUF1353 domain-containing protein [Rhodobacterales bacterium HKCCE4037]|nr:DUF1353 domain-containing protein [Rhodobacterales bacterium HKCCE4037]
MFQRGETRRWRVTRDFEWEAGRKGSGDWVLIPEGYEFESSVPAAFHWFLSPDDPRFLLAAMVHDFMLESGLYGRPQAAAEWYDGARAADAPAWKAKLAYIAVAAWAVLKPGAT